MENDAVMQAARKLGGAGGGQGLLFGMSIWGVMASLVFSGIGYFYFRRGRDQSDMVKIGCGIALMVFPYFVTNALYITLVGAALMAVPYLAERF